MAVRQKNGKGRKLGQKENDDLCTWKDPWVLGAIERGTLKCCLQRIIGPRSREVHLPILQKWLLSGTIVVSDKWKALTSTCIWKVVRSTTLLIIQRILLIHRLVNTRRVWNLCGTT